MKIKSGDRVILSSRQSDHKGRSAPAHLHSRMVSVLEVYPDGTFAAGLDGDAMILPTAAIAEVKGHGLGSAAVETL